MRSGSEGEGQRDRGCLGDEEVALLAKVEGEDSRRLSPGWAWKPLLS